MTTSTTALRAAVTAALAALLVVLATPTTAFASTVTVSAGAVTVKDTAVSTDVTVTNIAPRAEGVRVSVSATGEAAGLVDMTVEAGSGCKGSGTSASCGKMGPGKTKTFKVTVSPKSGGSLPEGQSKTGNIAYKVEGPNSGGGSSALTVEGYNQSSQSVSGVVTELDESKPVEGAKVKAKEKEGGSDIGEATTDGDGKFSIDADVEADTVVELTVTKDKFAKGTDEATAVAGQPVEFEIRMEKKEAAKSEAPKKDSNDTGDDGKDEDSGFTGTTWLLIILGALLVIGGVVAIWMLLRKGKDDDEDDFEALPNEPPTHQFSASQTGRHGIYEGSGPRPGQDNPTMIHQGPLVNDDDLARYGSEPASSGFGPAYGDGRPTQMVDPRRGEPISGATQMYPSSGREPNSGSTQMYPSSEPRSGAPAYYSEPHSSAPAYPAEPHSGSTQRYPATDRDPHREEWSSGGRQSREQWGGGYGEQQQPRSSGRHYREDGYDDYDDRPRSW